MTEYDFNAKWTSNSLAAPGLISSDPRIQIIWENGVLEQGQDLRVSILCHVMDEAIVGN